MRFGSVLPLPTENRTEPIGFKKTRTEKKNQFDHFFYFFIRFSIFHLIWFGFEHP